VRRTSPMNLAKSETRRGWNGIFTPPLKKRREAKWRRRSWAQGDAISSFIYGPRREIGN
jgi:hypothetical protein